MSDLDTVADVQRTLKDLRDAATRVCVLTHILESRNPDKKALLETMREASMDILEKLDWLEGRK